MPIPVATLDRLDKENAQPFVCQNSPCGCKTAEQCWTNCCCFTPAKRLAWAEKNGITPPSYAQRPTSDDTASDRKSIGSNVGEDAAEAKSNCGEPRKACCEKLTTKTLSSQTAKADRVESKALSSTAKRKVVLSMFVLKCQGKSSAFTLLPWTILASIEKVVMFEHEFGPAHQTTIEDPSPVFLKPDTPPPKQMLS